MCLGGFCMVLLGLVWFCSVVLVWVVLATAVAAGVVVRVWFSFVRMRLKCGLFWIIGAFGGVKFLQTCKNGALKPRFAFLLYFANT